MKKILILAISAIAFQLNGFSQQVISQPTTIELQGNFVSQQGVMTSNSCYGFNIGELYISNSDKEETKVICFDRMEYSAGSKIYCNHISVTGYFEKVTNNGEGSCKAGSKEIFFVTSYKCLD